MPFVSVQVVYTITQPPLPGCVISQTNIGRVLYEQWGRSFMPKNSEKNSVRWHSNPTCYQEEFFIKKGVFLAVQGTLNAIIWNFFVYECDHV